MLIHKSAFHLAKIAPGDDPRYGINGVRIEGDGTAVVTDGHRLVRVKAKGPDDSEYPEVDGLVHEEATPLEPFTLPADTCKAILKSFNARACRNLPVLENARIDTRQTNENGCAVVATTDLESPQIFRPQKIEGSFPRYENVYPKGEPAATVGVNARYLREIMDVLEKIAAKSRNESTVVKIAFYGDDKPIRIELTGSDRAADALLMPCHIG